MKKIPTRWSQSSRKVPKTDVEAPPVLQRVLIFHSGLLPPSGVLDEGSSLDELSEHILYYYDFELEQRQQQQQQDANGNNSTTSHATEEAVRFAGLCRALHSLPKALLGGVHDHHQPEERSQCIHLDRAMLVFVPLEEATSSTMTNNSDGLMAVAQVSTVQDNNNPVISPFVIQDLLEQWHKLFCILRGGGVDVRLKQLKPEQQQVGRNHGAVARHFDDYDQATTAASSAISSPSINTATTAGGAATLQSSSSQTDYDDTSSAETYSVVNTNRTVSKQQQQQDHDVSNTTKTNSYSHTAAALSLLAATSTSSTTASLLQASSGEQETFPGLEQLYSLRKEMRILQKDLIKSTQDFHEKKANLERQVEGCRSQLEEQLLLSTDILPSLREDLHIHYTERLLSLSNNRGFRLRLPKVTTTTAATQKPSSIDTPSGFFPALQLGRVIRNLLNDVSTTPSDNDSDNDAVTQTPLVGVSTFHRGDHWYSHFAAHLSMSGDTEATSVLLLEYLVSFRDHQGSNIRSMTTRFGGRRRKTPASDGALYLSTPPLSRLSVSEEIYQISHPMYETIWTPKVFLPSATSSNNNNSAASFHMVHVALLEIPATRHQFLLYFDPRHLSSDEDWTSAGLGEGSLSLVMDSPSQQSMMQSNNSRSSRVLSESNVVHEMFTSITRELTTCIQNDLVATTPSKTINNGSNSNNTKTAPSVWKHPGTVVILVENSIVQNVYMGPKKSGSGGGGSAAISSSSKHPIISGTSYNSSISTSCYSKNDMNGTLQLSEAAWMALEDYFFFGGAQKERNDVVEQEACEYLFDQSGWIWCCRKQHRALYMILDSSTFVTIAEVESCTDKARQMFLL